jgi:peptide/nickel transport system ATP-binding protein
MAGTTATSSTAPSAAAPTSSAVGAAGKAHLRDPEEHDVLVRVDDLVVEFPAGRGRTVHAVSGVSLDIVRGETLGLVGESGCGKSTTGRAIMQLPPPTGGHVRFEDVDLTGLGGEELRRVRTRLQMIFQDPISSLNPRRKVREIVSEGLSIWNKGKVDQAKVDEVLEAVGLDPAVVSDRRPHQFSGGQCQRICIARALVLDPTVIICDEPVSALDVSVQAQILNLLEDMKARYGLTLLFIAHDLAVVKNISDRVAVMYLGKLCEVASPDDLFDRPAHPYTRALMASIPVADPGAVIAPDALSGELPSPIAPPSGCRFRTRCPRADQRCIDEEPALLPVADDHFVACHHPHGADEPVPVTIGKPDPLAKR